MTRALSIVLVLSASLFAAIALAPRAADASLHAASDQYSARGVVRSFGPNRAYVNIAHEKIPGFMEAMTMSFEPRRADQVASLAAGDKVVFTFTSSEGGHRFLDAITKQ